MTPSQIDSGIVRFTSPFAFDDTVQRLLAAFKERGIKVFATIDQQAEAIAVSLSMPPTTLILFGNPAAGTPLMLDNPASGLDLPLKALVVEAEPDKVEVFINAAKYVIERHDLPHGLEANLLPAEKLIAHVLEAPGKT
ncbi:DUF302 domain-containing protein [Dyella acidisoli]|uniref:DUF302 domain-containing protein n=1 Tax=Dyella acidisoli TaxID=1867834 RepID=A0ABQ5XU80_9GAMM|nr:DUF302 domain-containing protein [Dyella acidisoli]GLQ94056.1 hypothetical protein GCM10007901_30070 [Dyella acidisoli]